MLGLQVRNFQKHAKLKVKFDPRITTIVGPSDSGKSSIIRALRWVVFNRPRGKGFIQDGKEKAAVLLALEEGNVIRDKRKNGNSYDITKRKDGFSSSGLSAVGDSVPESVQQVLNMGDVNFQLQHDPPFWFSLTAGEVAKRLNQIVDLELIDKVASGLAHRARKASNRVDVTTELVERGRKRVGSLEYVAKVADDWDRVELLGKKLEELEGEIEHLSSWMDQVGEVQRNLEIEIPDLSGVENAKLEWEGLREKHKELWKLLTDLRIRRESVEDCEKEVEEVEEELRKWKKEKRVCPTCGRPWNE